MNTPEFFSVIFKKSVDQLIRDFFQLWIFLAQLSGVVIVLSVIIFYLFGRKSENKDVVLPYKFMDLYIGSIHSTQGNRAVEHKFHVAGTTGLFSCCRNLFADIRRRIDELPQADAEILQENYFQLPADGSVIVDHIRYRVDKADYFFGKVVALGRFP